ncbi:glycerol-3-phosphate acyltransferase, partial [Salmonella sp. NW387]|uniref:glycerol-3-phosphate acyltransferase n=1 Tax=Salmonella sp. NW387 TaxID=2947947 RepID=UPI003F41EF4A
GLALATLILDALKGALAVYASTAYATWWLLKHPGTAAAGPAPFAIWPTVSDPHTLTVVIQAASLAALGAVVGHMFPVWLRFKG